MLIVRTRNILCPEGLDDDITFFMRSTCFAFEKLRIWETRNILFISKSYSVLRLAWTELNIKYFFSYFI